MTCKQESVLLTVAAYQMVFIYDKQRRKKAYFETKQYFELRL